MKTASKVKELIGWNGDATLYFLSEPIYNNGQSYSYVIVSAVYAYSGPETYIFPADESGDVLDWEELNGSFRGACNKFLALENAGYKIVK